MPLSRSRRTLLRGVLAALGLVSAGCGTILHPDRRGQPAGRLDWGVVALDAVGLLFFFVPGVIAFAVDFSTGAIYLPPNRYGRHNGSSKERSLSRVNVPPEQLSVAHVERVVGDHAERSVRLRSGSFEARELDSMDEFWAVHDDVVPV